MHKFVMRQLILRPGIKQTSYGNKSCNKNVTLINTAFKHPLIISLSFSLHMAETCSDKNNEISNVLHCGLKYSV
jgi:hypothetical protein